MSCALNPSPLARVKDKLFISRRKGEAMQVFRPSIWASKARFWLGGALLLCSLSASAEKESPPPPKKEKASAADYELDLQKTTTALSNGGDGFFVLQIRAKNGTKVHPEAPLEVSLKSDEALQLEKAKLGRGDANQPDDTTTELRTSFHARQNGTHTLAAELSFFLCTDTWCQRMTDRVETSVVVSE